MTPTYGYSWSTAGPTTKSFYRQLAMVSSIVLKKTCTMKRGVTRISRRLLNTSMAYRCGSLIQKFWKRLDICTPTTSKDTIHIETRPRNLLRNTIFITTSSPNILPVLVVQCSLVFIALVRATLEDSISHACALLPFQETCSVLAECDELWGVQDLALAGVLEVVVVAHTWINWDDVVFVGFVVRSAFCWWNWVSG